MAFDYRSENGKTLTPSQETILEDIENHPFPFEGLSKLKDLRNRTGVSVVISDRGHLISFLNNSIKSIKEKISEYQKSGLMRNSNVETDIYNRLNWAKEQLKNAENPETAEVNSLLGLYSRKLLWFDNSAPEVFLFADNIKDYVSNHPSMTEDNVFAFVFVHEMMHAYYDAFNSDGFLAKEQLEEAFAEYGMLAFLHGFGMINLFTEAKDSVHMKIINGPREYGFGLELFARNDSRDYAMINRYKYISNRIDYSTIYKDFNDKGHGNFFSDMANYKTDPDATNADNCFKDVRIILNYFWKQPSISPQQKIGSRHSTFHPTSRLPRFSPMVLCSPTQTINQFCLISEREAIPFIATIIRLLKHVGFESKLSFIGPDVVYLGESLFGYSNTTSASDSKIVIPESICINGATVYPVYPGTARNTVMRPLAPWRLCLKLIRILSTIFGETFSFDLERKYFLGGWRYSLYGPALDDEYTSILFPKRHIKHHSYDIIVRETSQVLGQDVRMHKVPFIVIKHFCENNKSITWIDLQKIFDQVDYPRKYLDWITPKPIVDAYYASFPDLQIPNMDLEKWRSFNFFEDLITVASGETFLVTRKWFSQDAFHNYLRIADGLGYEILEH